MRTFKRARSRGALAALLTVAAMGLSACSDSESGGSDEVDSSALGEKNEASGDPFTVGFVYDGVSAGNDESANLSGAEAAVEYVNTNLGGVGGRPLALEVCATKQTPAGAKACVAQMAKAEVPIVLTGRTGQGADLFSGLKEAEINQLVYQSLDDTTLRSPSVNLLGNSLLAIVGLADVAVQEKVDRVALVTIDVPETANFEQLTVFFENQGLETDIVKVPLGTSDLSPAIGAELKKNPGLINIIGDPPFCASAFKAMQELGYKGITSAVSGCLTEENSKGLTNVEDTVILAGYTLSDGEEASIYKAALDAYGDDKANVETSVPGYAVMLAFARALSDYQGEASKDGIWSALSAAKDVQMPLADGVTFTCDQKQVTIVPSVCSNQILKLTLGKDSVPKKVEVIDGAELLKVG